MASKVNKRTETKKQPKQIHSEGSAKKEAPPALSAIGSGPSSELEPQQGCGSKNEAKNAPGRSSSTISGGAMEGQDSDTTSEYLRDLREEMGEAENPIRDLPHLDWLNSGDAAGAETRTAVAQTLFDSVSLLLKVIPSCNPLYEGLIQIYNSPEFAAHVEGGKAFEALCKKHGTELLARSFTLHDRRAYLALFGCFEKDDQPTRRARRRGYPPPRRLYWGRGNGIVLPFTLAPHPEFADRVEIWIPVNYGLRALGASPVGVRDVRRCLPHHKATELRVVIKNKVEKLKFLPLDSILVHFHLLRLAAPYLEPRMRDAVLKARGKSDAVVGRWMMSKLELAGVGKTADSA